MTPEELLDATLAKARKVPVGGRVDPAEAARRSIESARIEARVVRARRGRFLAGAAVAVAVLGLGWGAWSLTRGWASDEGAAVAAGRESQGEGAPAPAVAPDAPAVVEPRLRLASGDVLIGSPRVAFEVLSDQGERVVRLDDGEMLFDVVHQPSGSFVVRTDDFTVTVLGTVFSVRREDDTIGVRVFEGSVLVRGTDGAELQRLGAGDLWVSGALDDLERWRVRSEREWNAIVRDGHRSERRAALAGPVESARVGDGPAAAEEPPSNEAASSAGPMASARSMLARGDFEEVLRASEGHAAEGEWLLLRADALRGLGRSDEAARSYESAAQRLRDDRRIQAAFAAAQLRAETAPAAAARLLERFGVIRASSPLEERARALQIRLLRSLDRHEEADAAELAYEDRFGSR